jgi:hypothetical protein
MSSVDIRYNVEIERSQRRRSLFVFSFCAEVKVESGDLANLARSSD